MSAPVVWINGPLGVGKSHTAAYLQERQAGSFLFDPEEIGYALRRLTPHFSGDFQLRPLWVSFVLDALEYAARTARGLVLVPMTVTELARQMALIQGLQNRGLVVHHFTLLAPPEVVYARLRRRAEGRQSWAGQQVNVRLTDLQHPAFALHLNTGRLTVSQVAEAIATSANLVLSPKKRDPLGWLRRPRRFLR